MIALSPWTFPLRPWQEASARIIVPRSEVDSLIVATPGSGKTKGSLRIAHAWLASGIGDRIQVVAPTDHLRRQWAIAGAEVGLQLDPNVSNDRGREGRDYHGAVVTYHQVSAAPDVWRRTVEQKRSVLILDEVHHACDAAAWGTALRSACDPAVRRLSLSGTPFRSDNVPIPFVRYEHHRSVADFTYGYPEALVDRVCRPILFPSFEGEISWSSSKGTFEKSFLDRVSDPVARERLKAAVLLQGWLRQVLVEADGRLQQVIRRTHPDAGGLVITMDQEHAKWVATLLEGIAGCPVPVATCDDPDASDTIARFGRSSAPWLVAVKMVSEGVDIPRLRVGVYASHILTEMYFRQAVGRFVRMQAELGPTQEAYLYLPADPTLVGFARVIQEERRHALKQLERQGAAKSPRQDGPFAGPSTTVTPLKGVARAHETIRLFDETTGPGRGTIGPNGETIVAIAETNGAKREILTLPLFTQKDQLRDIHARLVGQVARRTKLGHRAINQELIKRTGGRIEYATVQQLEQRIVLLEQWREKGAVA